MTGVWEVVRTNDPHFPVTCEGCGTTARFVLTYRVTFSGMTHRLGATPAERRHHGPGLWVCARCCSVLRDNPPDLVPGAGVRVRGYLVALEAPEPEQGEMF